jgi:importin subunit beta-1
MQVVCEATQSQSEDVQVGAYQCLVRIMSLYYEKMSFYMERALFGVRQHGLWNVRGLMTVNFDGYEESE